MAERRDRPSTASRRRFLGALTLPLAAGGLPSRRPSSTPRLHGGTSFDPAVHGFGFQNWSTSVPTYPEHDHDAVSEAQVRRTLRGRWTDALRRVLDLDVGATTDSALDVIAKQLYVSVNQRSATNGHCYGMVFAAQRYFEEPGAVPLDRERAREFTNPSDPLDDPGRAPVGEDIDHFQNTQFLDFRAWLGRRAVFRPRWIDYASQLEDLRAVIDEYGTAGVTLVNTETRSSHQVLLHGHRTRPASVTFDVYDPNLTARGYGPNRNRPTIRVDTDGEAPLVEPYGDLGYDAFVYNRYDRLIAAGAGDGPVERPPADLRDSLFPVGLFLTDADVALAVVDGDGRPLARTVSAFMDRRNTEYDRMRVRYGMAPGRYRVVVTGNDATDYTLSADVAGLEGELLSATVSSRVRAGEVHEYEAVVPASPDGEGSLERVGRTLPLSATGVLGVGAAGFAAGAYAVWRRRETGRQT